MDGKIGLKILIVSIEKIIIYKYLVGWNRKLGYGVMWEEN